MSYCTRILLSVLLLATVEIFMTAEVLVAENGVENLGKS